MTALSLTLAEQKMLDGSECEATALSMRIMTAFAHALGAERLLPASSAHVDGCLYHGEVGLHFAEQLAGLGARVAIPTTLNVASLDLIHPELFQGNAAMRQASKRLMDAYVAMGCQPTWTCAPYQLRSRPTFGEHVAWAESNAIVFANSVLGARTGRYGDFIDICAAVTARVPYAGLHLTKNRWGQVVFDVGHLSARVLDSGVFFPVLGHLIGLRSGTAIPVITGLPAETGEDQLKVLGAAAASSGGVALFHAVGITPEARTLEEALGNNRTAPRTKVTKRMLAEIHTSLSSGPPNGPIDAVSIGTPHFSIAECAQLVRILQQSPTQFRVDFYVSTSRAVLEEVRHQGWYDTCERAGITFVVDTCTYVTSILRPGAKVVMTNSAKWAYYAPGNIGVQVVFGSLEDCIRSASEGRIVRDESLWLSA